MNQSQINLRKLNLRDVINWLRVWNSIYNDYFLPFLLLFFRIEVKPFIAEKNDIKSIPVPKENGVSALRLALYTTHNGGR